MPNIINADDGSVSGIAGIKQTADSSGALILQANGVNAISISNTAVVTVSSSISGNGAGLTDINASNISSGTIANARTTAASANGASTIVARDSSGNFTANAVTLTTGSFAGGSNTAPSITFTGDTNTGIFSPAADTIAFTEGGVESMRIDASGKVGIGITTINSVYASTLGIGGSGSSASLQFRSTNTGTATSDGFDVGLLDSGNTDAYVWQRESGPLIFGTASTERMRITSTGNVGIGTSSPSAKLDVRYTSFTPTSSIGSVLVEESTAWAQGIQFYINNAGTFFSSRPSGAIGAANSGGLWLTAGSIITNNPAAANGFTASSTGASTYQAADGTHVWYGNTGLTAGNTFTATERMRIASNGALGFSGANYGSSGQVLTSNGSGSAPSWQSPSGGVTSLNGQTGAITNTSLDAIGSTGQFYYAGTSNLVGGNTIAGSNLYYSTAITETFDNFWKTQTGDPNRCDADPGAGITRYTSGNTGFQPPTAASNLSGTWRVMNAVAQRFSSFNGAETRSRCWTVVAMRVS